MSPGMRMAERIDRKNGWDRREKKSSATANLARVLGLDHGDRVSYVNLTREPAWPGMR
jgi:hypothetical protein